MNIGDIQVQVNKRGTNQWSTFRPGQPTALGRGPWVHL